MASTITWASPVLARYARRFLFIELATYGIAAGVLFGLGIGWWMFPVTVVGLALLMRCVAVAGTFATAALFAPAGSLVPRSAAVSVRLVTAELVWTTLAYSVLMPFPLLFGRADSRLPAKAGPGTVPVLLLHGYICNGGIWTHMRRFLESNGVATYIHDLEPVYAGIDDYVDALAGRIEDICRSTGSPHLVIVAHSMGGLAARAYLRARGPVRVAKLITLGTPHHGTRNASLGLGANARQMEPGSSWLESLARGDPGAAAAPVTSIYSSDDNVVVPQESSVLEGAKNLRVSGIGHVSLAFSRTVQQMVLEELPRAGSH